MKADKTKALEMFNAGEGGFRDGDLYVFCADISDGAPPLRLRCYSGDTTNGRTTPVLPVQGTFDVCRQRNLASLNLIVRRRAPEFAAR